MSKYNIGDKVIKTNSEEHGIVFEVMPPRRGRQLYKVAWGNNVTDELEGYYNYQIFDNRLQENRPFVEALTDLNHHMRFPAIAKKLDSSEIITRFYSDEVEIYSHETTVGDAFSNDAMYKEIQKMLHGEDNLKNRARLQYLISSMSMMNNIFSRTRKREVTTDLSQAERKPHMRKVVLTEREREDFDAVIEQYLDDNSYTDDWGEEVMTRGGALGLVQKKCQIASSVFAYLNSESNLEKGIVG